MKFKHLLLALPVLGLALFLSFCSKEQGAVPPDNGVGNNDQTVSSRSPLLQVTPVYASGNCWRVIIKEVGTTFQWKLSGCPSAGYTVVPFGSAFSVPNPTNDYKKYIIQNDNLNVFLKFQSDAGCLSFTSVGNAQDRIYAGGNSDECNMTLKVNSASATNWKADVLRQNAQTCANDVIATIGGPASGAAIIIATGQTISLPITGFQATKIKQITGNVNYTLDAPSAPWAPIIPGGGTFTANAGQTPGRILGCGL